MDQQYHRSAARLCDVQADAVARDGAMPYLVHSLLLQCRDQVQTVPLRAFV